MENNHGKPEDKSLEVPGSIEEFFDWQAQTLTDSRNTWISVSSQFRPYQDGTVLGHLEGFIDDNVDSLSGSLESSHDRAKSLLHTGVKRLPGDLASYFLTYANARSLRTDSLKDRLIFARGLTNVPDPTVKAMIKSLLKDGDQLYSQPLIELPKTIEEGHAYRHTLINNLAIAIYHRPELLFELADLSHNQNGRYSMEMAELKKVCTIDWHLPDWYMVGEGSPSVLKSYIDYKKRSPEENLPGFIQAVEQANQSNSPLWRIKEMARFAIAAADITDGSAPDIGQVMKNSKERWADFQDVEVAFQAYCDESAQRVEHAIKTLVSHEDVARGSIRYPRNQEDLETVRKSFSGYFDSSMRSKRTHSMLKACAMGRGLPSVDRIVSEEVNGRCYKLAAIKQLENGVSLETTEKSCLLEQFNHDANLQHEISRVLDSLVNNPLGMGTRGIKAKPIIWADGQALRLRRFSPGKRPGMSVGGEARRYRVIYAVSPEQEVGVLGIVRRDHLERYLTSIV